MPLFALSARAKPAGKAVTSRLSPLDPVPCSDRKARSSSRPCKVELSECPQPVKSGEAGTGATRTHAQPFFRASMGRMARTHLLTGEDAEIRSLQDGAQTSSKNKNFSPQGCPIPPFIFLSLVR